MSSRVLVVDDDNLVRKYLSRGFARADFTVDAASSGREAIEILKRQQFDAIVCDLRMKHGDGLQVLDFARSLPVMPAFVVLTAYATVKVAVEAVQLGADDFLEKPVEIDALVNKIRTLVETKRHQSGQYSVAEDGLVGSSAWLGRLRKALKQLARSDATLVIEGEVGTGKRLIAKAIWQASYRSRRPFVTCSCADVSFKQFGSRLFGVAPGVRTPDDIGEPGKLAKVSGGVLAIEEVDELDPDLQPKLLQVLQERRYRPLGGKSDEVVDARFIATTRRNLWDEVQADRFRSDLFFRLNVLRLEVPALRDRPDDIPILVEHFREQLIHGHDETHPTFTAGAIEALIEYPWPGNVRQLRNIVERLLRSAGANEVTTRQVHAELMRVPFSLDDELMVHITGNLAPVRVGTVAGKSLTEAVRNFERRLILSALHDSGGNQSHAARRLNVHRTTLVEKIKRLGIRASE